MIKNNVNLELINQNEMEISKGPTINSWGGGGWVILKKNFLQALFGRKKLHAAQMT